MTSCRHLHLVVAVLALAGRSQAEFESSAADDSDETALLQHIALAKRRNSGLGFDLDADAVTVSQLMQVAADPTTSPEMRRFLKLLKPCARCSKFARFGEHHDGGYIMCTDGLADSGLEAAYSFGIDGRDGWGMDIASLYHIPLYEFDCITKASPPHACAGCAVKFFPECIRGKADSSVGGNYKTLEEHFSATGHGSAPDSSLLLKIDVEGAEWDVFSQAETHDLRQIRQITMEVHNLCSETDKERYLRALEVMSDAGFSVAHIHGNNYNKNICSFGQYSVPAVLEVTLIRRSPGSSGCDEGISMHVPLDEPNEAATPELLDAVLPAAL